MSFLKFIDMRRDLDPHETASCILDVDFAVFQITRIDV